MRTNNAWNNRYLHGRQNPLSKSSIEDIEKCLATIVASFGEKWLEINSGTHPLQILWNRKDALATCELYTFGKALITSEIVSPKWLKKQIKNIQSSNENNQRGAVFEVLTLDYAATHNNVSPAPSNQPGYDLDIETPRRVKYRASLKRHHQSIHEQLFKERAIVSENLAVSALRKVRKNALIYIQAKTYPTDSAWNELNSQIENIVCNFVEERLIYELSCNWLIAILPLTPDADEAFDGVEISYSFICLSPYHNNEQDNFLSKLQKAISNMERHIKGADGTIPSIFMQLPASASAHTLSAWAEEYLNTNASVVKAIIFFQPFISSNDDISSSFIAHYVTAAVSNDIQTIVTDTLRFSIPVGIFTTRPPEWILRSDICDINFSEHYIYQRGKHFISASRNHNGTQVGNIARKAPWVESYSVFNISGETLVLRGHWGEELCLIGGS